MRTFYEDYVSMRTFYVNHFVILLQDLESNTFSQDGASVSGVIHQTK